jgi:hypothetical protein
VTIEPSTERNTVPFINQDEQELDQLPAWHAPQLTRIDIKRTMLGVVSGFAADTQDLYLEN